MIVSPRVIDRLWSLIGGVGVAAIVWASLTAHPVDPGVPQGDKLQHLAGYGVLMFWFAQLPGSRWRLALGLILLGVLLEFAQSFTPARQTDLLDGLANALGVLLGWGSAAVLPDLRRWLDQCWASRG